MLKFSIFKDEYSRSPNIHVAPPEFMRLALRRREWYNLEMGAVDEHGNVRQPEVNLR